MIVNNTAPMLRVKALRELISVLEPIAKKYKAPRMAANALRLLPTPWHISQAEKATQVWCRIPLEQNPRVGHTQATEYFDVYEYGKHYRTLPEILAMLKRQLASHEPHQMPTVYDADLRKFIDRAIGSEVECTVKDFELRKYLTLELLTRATAYVASLDAPNTPDYDQFTKGEK